MVRGSADPTFDACWVCRQALPLVLAEVGRYPLRVSVAVVMLRYWNRLVDMDAGSLVKQTLLPSAALAEELACTNSITKPWAGQVVAPLASLNLPHDLNAPKTVDIKAAEVQLQCRYIAQVTDCDKIKVQQYLQMRSVLEMASYSCHTW